MFRHGTYYIIANDSDKTLETIIINYTHLFGYLNPYYRSAYNVPKRRK